MKVYQIFKATSWGDDYHRYSVGTYLHKSKAETEFKRLKAGIEPDCPHFKLKVWEVDKISLITKYRVEEHEVVE